jgi:hypothetical protein
MRVKFLLENHMGKGDTGDKQVEGYDNITTQKPMYTNKNSTMAVTKSA